MVIQRIVGIACRCQNGISFARERVIETLDVSRCSMVCLCHAEQYVMVSVVCHCFMSLLPE